MEHVVIPDGGGQYLPFARNLIRKLRALGLYAGSQVAEVDGYLIRARFAGEHDRISITDGGWLAYPVAVNLRTSNIHRKPTFAVVVDFSPIPDPPFPETPHYVYTAVPPRGNGSPLPDILAYVEIREGDGITTVYPGGQWVDIYPTAGNVFFPNPGQTSGVNQWLFQYTVDHPGPQGTVISNPGAFNAYVHAEFDAWNAEVATNRQWAAAEEARYNAELAIDSAYNTPLQTAYTNAVNTYVYQTLPAVHAANAAAYAAALAVVEAQKRVARVAARPGQVARLYAEVDKGVNAPWVSLGTLPPPITPRVKHAQPFPITIGEHTADAGTGSDAFTFNVKDVATGAERQEKGTRENQAQAGIPASCMLTFGRSVYDNMLVDKLVQLDQLFTRDAIIDPNQSFGYFATGYTEQLEGGVQTTATFTTPPEYYDWLSSGMAAAGVDDVIESDAYVMPGAALLLVHFEWEALDPFLQQWSWTPVPFALRYDAIYLCDSTGQGPQDFIPSSPVRKVRLRKVTKQVLGKDWVWSTPIDVALPEGTTFEHEVIASTETGLTDVPPAVAILSKLPSRTLPPKTDGALAKRSIYAARLKAEPALKALRKAEWSGDHLAADWVDRLVMEALNLTNTFRSNTE